METTLRELTGQWLQVADLLMDMDSDPQVVLDTLEGIEGEISIKADGYGDVIRKMEFERAAIKGKKEYVKGILDQLTKMDKHLENQIGWCKERVRDTMIATGLDESGITTEKYKFMVKKAGGPQKLEKSGKVPDNFKRIVYEDDDEKIREYLKDHECDWARLLPRTRYLDIKGV